MHSPMEEQNLLNAQLDAFKQQNPRIVEAMRVLHVDMDRYLRALAQLNPPTSISTNTASGG